ncbi:MAG: hypothetical protein AAB110_04425, partial [Candidatus Desantisbacteria bacterium]
YDSACLRRIEEMARDADMVVTTEKDMVRLAHGMRNAECGMRNMEGSRQDAGFPLFFLKIRLSIITPNWQKNLLRFLCSD